jgi:hypothetical protein
VICVYAMFVCVPQLFHRCTDLSMYCLSVCGAFCNLLDNWANSKANSKAKQIPFSYN